MPHLTVTRKNGGPVRPALIAGAGKRPLRLVEFFTVNIRNCNTRAAASLRPSCPGANGRDRCDASTD
jgi:hypothetical protein